MPPLITSLHGFLENFLEALCNDRDIMKVGSVFNENRTDIKQLG